MLEGTSVIKSTNEPPVQVASRRRGLEGAADLSGKVEFFELMSELK